MDVMEIVRGVHSICISQNFLFIIYKLDVFYEFSIINKGSDEMLGDKNRSRKVIPLIKSY